MDGSVDKQHQVSQVHIFGREYTLRSGESETYTREIAEYVDRKMTDIANQMNIGDGTKIAIKAALDIADQLVREKARRTEDVARATGALKRLGSSLDGVQDGTKRQENDGEA